VLQFNVWHHALTARRRPAAPGFTGNRSRTTVSESTHSVRYTGDLLLRGTGAQSSTPGSPQLAMAEAVVALASFIAGPSHPLRVDDSQFSLEADVEASAAFIPIVRAAAQSPPRL